jgi:hypothetical protein
VAVLKLSQIATSPSNPVAADTFVGVNGGNTDYQFSLTQLIAGIGGAGGSSITINTTPIVSGTSGRLFYDNAGVVGEAIVGSGLSLAAGTISAAAAGITINSSPIIGGTNGQLLYDNAGTVGEAMNFQYKAGINPVLTLANGTTGASGLSVFKTDDGAGNFERAVFDWLTLANNLVIGTDAGGTGSFRDLQFRTANGVDFYGAGVVGSFVNMNSFQAFRMLAGMPVGWVASGYANASSPDTALARSGTNIVGIVCPAGTTTAMGLHVYNTANALINPTTYERGVIDWTISSNVLTIGSVQTGGSARDVALVSNGTEVLRLLSATSPAGAVKFSNGASFSANAAVATVLGSVGPTGSHTTVQTWLTFVDSGGVTRYVPCF